MDQWRNFKGSKWQTNIDVRDFIQSNYNPYEGDGSFLANASDNTNKLWKQCLELFKQERDSKGVLGFDTRVTFANAFNPGYIQKDLEQIVGLQTEKPLVRAYMPFGGIRQMVGAAEAFGYKTDPKLDEIFNVYRKTQNQGIFDCYTSEMRMARHTHIITGLPDAYGRGRIIGDYRRVALYGLDFLMKAKVKEWNTIYGGEMTEDKMRLREEMTEQYKALVRMKEMAASYGFDISKPATNAKEAIQWTYFGYLAAIKEQNGAAMSIGRVSTFFDIYIERDIAEGKLTEAQAQELIDHFVMKLRLVRFMRAPEYNQLFSGDPVWATECVGGMGLDKRTLVTKSSFRMLHTLNTMGPSPEPNLTVLWSEKLPENFKKFCTEYSIKYSSIQYENDDLMRKTRGDDYGIACCVSAMKIGKEMQFFGARANFAKALLYAINNGYDEVETINPKTNKPNKLGPDLGQYPTDEPLEYHKVMKRLKEYMSWLIDLYVQTLNIIHYMHDKYNYEAAEMALYDTDVHRFFATGIAGMSVLTDSLSAIKYAKVTPIWKEVPGTKDKIAVDFKIEGDFPKFGNDNNKVDDIAIEILKFYDKELKSHKTYRDSEPTASILTITSNIVYGKNTGNTPDGRKAGAPFAPGANPMHNRDTSGAIASLCSVAKLPYCHACDGISNTFSIVPTALGSDDSSKVDNLVNMLDAYFKKDAHHLNVNVLNKETLLDAQKNPENYPQLTIRVSGYAVNFIKLTKEQQDEVMSRTFHQRM